MQIKVVHPEIRGGSLSWSPLRAPRATVRPNEVELHHPAGGPIAYTDIHLMSVVATERAETPDLLLFGRDTRRPFVVSTLEIRGPDLGSTAESTGDQIARHVLLAARRQNADLAVDQATLQFLDGEAAQTLSRDLTALATALGEILRTAGRI